MNNNERIQRLEKYASDLKQRLSAAVPPRHQGQEAGYKQMLEIDLKKTQDTINKLKGL